MTAYLLKGLPAAGEIVSWGDDTFKQVSNAPSGTDFSDVAPGGGFQSIAFRIDGSFAFWGGDGSALPVIPVLPAPLVGEFVDAAVSLTHFVAIRKDRTLVPWGFFLPSVTVVPPSGLRAKAVAGHSSGDVAIDMDGSLTQWGVIGTSPAGKFTKISARGNYAIALREDGRLFAWGGTLFGTLPDWTPDGSGHFYIDGPFIDIAAGPVQKPPLPPLPHVLALKADGSVQGWGANSFGESNTPPGVAFSTIGAGSNYSLGLDKNGHIHHWGDPGGTTKNGKPLQSVGNTPKGRFISISAAARHAVAVRVSPGS